VNINYFVAAAAAFIYLDLVLFKLPSARWPHMAAGAIVLAGGVFLMSRLLRGRTPLPTGVFITSIIGTVVLAVPNFPAMGGHDPGAVPIGFLGSQALVLLWIALRWSVPDPKKPRAGLRTVLTTSALSAIGLSVIATIGIIRHFVMGRPGVSTLLLVYPAYFVGLGCAGLVYWSLQGVAHLAAGRYLIGVLGGFCLYGAVAPIVMILDHEPMDIRMMSAVAAVCGFLVGPPVALGLLADDSTARHRNRR
jgi:hypothetical protein